RSRVGAVRASFAVVIAAGLTLLSCRRAREAQAAGEPVVEPRVEGDRLILAVESPQRSALQIVPARPAAPETLHLAGRLVRQQDVEAAEADLARARAGQQRAAGRLALYGDDSVSVNQEFRLRTPLRGFVVERGITPGQEVRPDQMLANDPQLFRPLFVVTDPS